MSVRRKGHSAELYYRNKFIEVGYVNCLSSRQASRLFDDLGIDLCNLPFLVQIKAGYKKTNMILELERYISRVIIYRNSIPDHWQKPFILIHRIDGTRGKKRSDDMDLVYMRDEDFKELCKTFDCVNINVELLGSKHIRTTFNQFLTLVKCT